MLTRVGLILATALCLAVPASLLAGDEMPKPIEKSEVSTITATILSIDQTNRLVTLKGEKGRVVTIRVPETVERFSAMKVGDVVTARYTESVAIKVARRGESEPQTSTLEAGVDSHPGEKPAGTATVTTSVTVKVKEIDLDASSLTVEKPDGTVVSFKVKDKDRLKKLKVGDDIDVTYTEALMIQVEGKK